jgi:hypothetical protein
LRLFLRCDLEGTSDTPAAGYLARSMVVIRPLPAFGSWGAEADVSSGAANAEAHISALMKTWSSPCSAILPNNGRSSLERYQNVKLLRVTPHSYWGALVGLASSTAGAAAGGNSGSGVTTISGVFAATGDGRGSKAARSDRTRARVSGDDEKHNGCGN